MPSRSPGKTKSAARDPDELRGQLVGPRRGVRLDVEVDVDLEVARADGRLHPVAVAARVRERLRDGRLARAEEAEDAQIGRLRSIEDPPYRSRLDGVSPQ